MAAQSDAISPRRLTGAEEAELRVAMARRDAACMALERISGELDQLVLELVDAGARVTDVADVLGISRNSTYAAIRRAEER